MSHQVEESAWFVLQRCWGDGTWTDTLGSYALAEEDAACREDLAKLRHAYGHANVRQVRRTMVVTDTIVDDGQ